MASQETHLQSLLEQLRTRLLVMCATVEEVVTDVCTALSNNDTDLANAVIYADSRINTLENEIDEMALSLIARSQPVARDLRLVVSSLRMVTDLERIGDEAANIAGRVLLLQDSPRPTDFELIQQMMELSKTSLHNAIIAFRDEDVTLALQICRGKDNVSQMEVRLLQKVMHKFVETAGTKENTGWSTLHTILIARSLSRILGRTSNIAEHCYFMKQGVSIKHTAVPHSSP